MPRAALVLAALLASLLAAPAAAGEAPCWIDNGAVVVSAAIGDIAGDFILDPAAPRSILHLDRAQLEGLDGPTYAATLSVAGERFPASLAIASIDARSLGLPTTINGVIGADVLANWVVDLRFSPCRLALSRRAPAPHYGRMLPIAMMAGVPAVQASISDGRLALAGWFAVSTDDAGVRVSNVVAGLSRKPRRIDPNGRYRAAARLAALGVADRAMTNLPASLQADAPPGLIGELGDVVWERYAAIRLDIRRRQLWLTAATEPRRPSGRRRARSGGS
jgi:hypothetical protein